MKINIFTLRGKAAGLYFGEFALDVGRLTLFGLLLAHQTHGNIRKEAFSSARADKALIFPLLALPLGNLRVHLIKLPNGPTGVG